MHSASTNSPNATFQDVMGHRVRAAPAPAMDGAGGASAAGILVGHTG